MVDGHALVIFCWDISVSTHFLSRVNNTEPFPRYVAMHAMQEDSGNHDHSNSNGYADGGSQRKQPKPQMRDTLAAIGGMLIPLLTQVGPHQ